MTVLFSIFWIVSLFVFIGFFFFSCLMFSGDGTSHPIKDGFKFLGISFVGFVVFCLSTVVLTLPINHLVSKENVPLDNTFVVFGSGDGLTVHKKPDLAYALNSPETQKRLQDALSVTLYPTNEHVNRVEYKGKGTEPITKATLEIRENAMGVRETVLVLTN